jgi:small multidrug resistance pump
MNSYLALALAIGLEVFATTMLKASDGLSKPLPAVVTLVSYGISFFFLSQALKELPTGVAYAIWSGIGIVLVSLLSWLFFKQRLDTPALTGIGFILLGVVVINLFSKTTGH